MVVLDIAKEVKKGRTIISKEMYINNNNREAMVTVRTTTSKV